jgi:hypothetical protein
MCKIKCKWVWFQDVIRMAVLYPTATDGWVILHLDVAACKLHGQDRAAAIEVAITRCEAAQRDVTRAKFTAHCYAHAVSEADVIAIEAQMGIDCVTFFRCMVSSWYEAAILKRTWDEWMREGVRFPSVPLYEAILHCTMFGFFARGLHSRMMQASMRERPIVFAIHASVKFSLILKVVLVGVH